MRKKKKNMKRHDLFATRGFYAALPPGTIRYTGKYTEESLKIELFVYDKESVKVKHLTDIQGTFDSDKVYWFNIVGLNHEAFIKKMGDKFDLHPMDLEDIVHVSQWSKIDVSENGIFSLFKMIYEVDKVITHEHVSIVMRDNVILTFQETPGDVFDHIRKSLEKGDTRIRHEKAAYLYYALIDALVDQYFTILNTISTQFMDLEMRILDNNFKEKEELYHLRKELLYFINSVTPIREAIQRFLVGVNPFVSEEMKPFYADLGDHLNQIYEALKSYKEMTNSLSEIQMSNTSNEMNKNMMTLTVFSAIFIPLSFLSGVYGMNFKFFPGLDSPYGFYIFCAVCLCIAGSLTIYFKKKRF